MANYERLKSDLSSVFNINGVDSDTNTPDYVLAEMVVDHIKLLKTHHERRDRAIGIGDPDPTAKPALRDVDVDGAPSASEGPRLRRGY